MLIRVTDRHDGTGILLNGSHILMVRPMASGGSTIYLACGSLHHPDILTVSESVDDLSRALEIETETAAIPAPHATSAAH